MRRTRFCSGRNDLWLRTRIWPSVCHGLHITITGLVLGPWATTHETLSASDYHSDFEAGQLALFGVASIVILFFACAVVAY